MPNCWALDLVIEVTLRRLWRAPSKAARMMRSQPRRVKIAVWIAISCPPHGQQQAVGRDVVRHVGAADGAQLNGIMLPELIPSIFVHHAAGLLVKSRMPGETIPLQRNFLVTDDGGVGDTNRLLN